MKKIIAIFAVILMTFSVSAQVVSYNNGRKYAGYYVSNKGDTVNGFLSYGNDYQSQVKCFYYPNENDNAGALTFKPEEISSYFVGDKLYRSIHYSGGLLEKPLRFNRVMKDGAITTFLFYDESGEKNADGTPRTVDVYYKANDPANTKPLSMQDFGVGFAKKMAAFVADDEELSKKVAAKEKGYGMLKMLEIIDEYNLWYASK